METVERTSLNESVEYIRRLVGRAKLRVLQNRTSTNEYRTHNQSGLFHMFLHKSFFESVRQWTNTNMTSRSHTTEPSEISIEELYGYVGLEIAASITQLNCLKD